MTATLDRPAKTKKAAAKSEFLGNGKPTKKKRDADTFQKDDGSWWIDSSEANPGVPEYGPYQSKKEAEEDRVGVVNAIRELRRNAGKGNGRGDSVAASEAKVAAMATPDSHAGSVREAVRLLGEFTGGRFDIVLLSGRAKTPQRQAILEALVGHPSPQADSAPAELRAALYPHAGEIGKGDEADAKFLEWAQALLKSNAEPAAIDAAGGKEVEAIGDLNAVATDAASVPVIPAADTGAATQPAAGEDFMDRTSKNTVSKVKGEKIKHGRKAPAANGKPKASGGRWKKVFGEHNTGPFVRYCKKQGVSVVDTIRVMAKLGVKVSDSYVRMKYANHKKLQNVAELSKDQAAKVGEVVEFLTKTKTE